ncbi:MAG: GGDEF domain-containing protein [Myxococcales bacterium]|nr:MAG: GGDEF domain-containing protein [Myxococcales bacterium]
MNATTDRETQLYRSVLDTLHDGVYFVDAERRITYWNEAAQRISGYHADDVMGRCCADHILVHVNREGEALCETRCPFTAAMRDRAVREETVYLHHKHGHRVAVAVRVSPLYDNSGRVIGAAQVFTENTAEQSLAEENQRLRALALIDPLTEIGNRRYLFKAVADVLNESSRLNWPFGVIFADIDSFKGINDRFGHPAGDRVLKMVAGTLAGGVRSYDLAGRWGGEEFVVLVKRVARDQVRAIAEKLRVLVERSHLDLDRTTLRVTASFGATAALPGDSPDSIVARADQLMYRAKQEGRNRVAID